MDITSFFLHKSQMSILMHLRKPLSHVSTAAVRQSIRTFFSSSFRLQHSSLCPGGPRMLIPSHMRTLIEEKRRPFFDLYFPKS